MSKKKILIVSAATFVIVMMSAIAGMIGLSTVSALIGGSNFSTIVNNIVKKFNLNPADVEQVFTDTRTQAFTARLDELVTAGKITADQEKLIISKQAEVQKLIEDINKKQLTVSERQTEMQKIRDDLSKWAIDNKIPEQYLRIGGMGRGGMHGGPLKGGGRGMM